MDSIRKTALIILNYNNYEDTINCIESVELYNTAPVKYIVVDNGSTRGGTCDYLNHYLMEKLGDSYLLLKDGESASPNILPYVTFVVSETNDGYAQGNNKGLKYAYADDEITDIMIINNDILFVEDIVPQLLSVRPALKKPGILSPILYKRNLDGFDYNCARLCHTNWEIILTFLFMYRDIFHYISNHTHKRQLLRNPCIDMNKPIEVELPSGSCMLIEKELMKEIGGFDAHTFLYFEENILFKKLERIGLKNYLLPNLKCIHLGAMSTSKSSSSFMLMSSLNSASYYLKKMGKMDSLQKIIWSCACCLIKIKLFFIK